MKTTKFTFKRHKRESGVRAVGYPYPWVDIKLGGKVVGHIVPPNWTTKDNLFRLRFAVLDAPTRKWIQLTFRGKTEQEAREFILANSNVLQSKFSFYYFEE